MLYINMNQPQMYIYSLQIYLRNTVDSVSDHYNKANITKKKKQVIWIFWFPSASHAPLLKDGENIYTCMTKSLASTRVPWQE